MEGHVEGSESERLRLLLRQEIVTPLVSRSSPRSSPKAVCLDIATDCEHVGNVLLPDKRTSKVACIDTSSDCEHAEHRPMRMRNFSCDTLIDSDIAKIREFENRCILRFGTLDRALFLLDGNSDRVVREEQFLNAIIMWELNAKELWNIFDVDGSGEVSTDQIRRICTASRRSGATYSSYGSNGVTAPTKSLAGKFRSWQRQGGRHSKQSNELDTLWKLHDFDKQMENDKFQGVEHERSDLLLFQGFAARKIKGDQTASKTSADIDRCRQRPWSAGAVSSGSFRPKTMPGNSEADRDDQNDDQPCIMRAGDRNSDQPGIMRAAGGNLVDDKSVHQDLRMLSGKLQASMLTLDEGLNGKQEEPVPHEEVLSDFKKIFAKQKARHEEARFSVDASRRFSDDKTRKTLRSLPSKKFNSISRQSVNSPKSQQSISRQSLNSPKSRLLLDITKDKKQCVHEKENAFVSMDAVQSVVAALKHPRELQGHWYVVPKQALAQQERQSPKSSSRIMRSLSMSSLANNAEPFEHTIAEELASYMMEVNLSMSKSAADLRTLRTQARGKRHVPAR